MVNCDVWLGVEQSQECGQGLGQVFERYGKGWVLIFCLGINYVETRVVIQKYRGFLLIIFVSYLLGSVEDSTMYLCKKGFLNVSYMIGLFLGIVVNVEKNNVAKGDRNINLEEKFLGRLRGSLGLSWYSQLVEILVQQREYFFERVRYRDRRQKEVGYIGRRKIR